MNLVILDGRLWNIPKISFIQIKGKSVVVCKFVIGVKTCEVKYGESHDVDFTDDNVDFFECVAFEHMANSFNKHFSKGEKIIVRGQIKNFLFEDINRTPHFTNIILVEQVEYNNSELSDLSVVTDLKETDMLFKKICDAGFLCLDEDDYYKIAVSGMK